MARGQVHFWCCSEPDDGAVAGAAEPADTSNWRATASRRWSVAADNSGEPCERAPPEKPERDQHQNSLSRGEVASARVIWRCQRAAGSRRSRRATRLRPCGWGHRNGWDGARFGKSWCLLTTGAWQRGRWQRECSARRWGGGATRAG